MGISGINPNISSNPVPSNSGNAEGRISQLEQRLQQLEKEKQKAGKGNDAKRAKEIEKQIQQIQKQIAQLRQQNKKEEEVKQESAPVDNSDIYSLEGQYIDEKV